MATLGRIQPKKVPAHMAKKGTGDRPKDDADDITESGPKRVWLFFVIFGVIVAAMIGAYYYNQYRAQSVQDENQYNGFDFWQADGGIWVGRVQVGQQPYDIPFYYHPRDTELVISDPSAIEPLYRAPREVFISIDPDAGAQVVIGGVEIARLTGSRYNLFNLETRSALSRPIESKVDIPVMNCANATEDRVVIQFVEGQQNVVARSDRNPNCIILQYTDANESIRVADKFAYMLLKIQ